MLRTGVSDGLGLVPKRARRSARRRATHDEHRAARLVRDPLADAPERLQPPQPPTSDDEKIGRLGLDHEHFQRATVPLFEFGRDSLGNVTIDLITRGRHDTEV